MGMELAVRWLKKIPTFVRVATVTVLVLTLTATPVSADFFSQTQPGTYQTAYSYASPLTLCPYGPPCSLRIVAESDLNAGYSGAQICRGGGGTVLYTTTVTSYVLLIANWGGDPNTAIGETVTPGDTWSSINSNTSNQVRDTDSDGSPGPKDDYTLSFVSMVYGRSATISYAYGLGYPTPTCNQDGWSTSTVVQSRATPAEGASDREVQS